jgi:hypothetical protein
VLVWTHQNLQLSCRLHPRAWGLQLSNSACCNLSHTGMLTTAAEHDAGPTLLFQH